MCVASIKYADITDSDGIAGVMLDLELCDVILYLREITAELVSDGRRHLGRFLVCMCVCVFECM